MQSRKHFLRAFFFLFLLTCLLTALVGTVRISPVRAISSNIVISQVYGGGGNAGTMYKNDFVELFNLSTTATISLAGWSIQYASATGTSWAVTNLSGTIAPGQYYLVQEAQGAGGTTNLPTPDAIGTIPMAATVGKVALVNTTTALSGSGCPFDVSVIDFVGYGTGGTGADCFEGSGSAPTLINTTADIRGSSGCSDTDNNNNDFTAGTPTPRNTNSIGIICGVGTYTPTLTPSPVPPQVVISEIAWAGTEAFSGDEWIELYNNGGTNIDITGWRLEAADGDPSIILNGTITGGGFFLLERGDNNVVSDVVANQIYTSGLLSDTGETLRLLDSSRNVVDTANSNGGAWPAGSASPTGSMERIITGGVVSADNSAGWITNGQPTTWATHDAANNLVHGTPGYGNWAFSVTPTASNTPTATSTSTATITATSTRTLTPTRTPTGLIPATNIVISEFRTIGPNGGNDEFIELYNPTNSVISITNWKINKSSGCGTTISTVATIPSGVTLTSGQHYLIGGGSYSGSVNANLSTSLNIADNGGIALLDASNNVIDEVGLCSATFYHEGTALTSLTTNTNRSYDRKSSISGVCVDTNNNIVDFILRSPSDPQNLSSPLTKCGNPTPTPTNTPKGFAPTKFRTSTPIPPPPPPLVAINEFVPRPGHDWNNDGEINIGDEYIELLNHGVIDVNLSGYRLDDEANIGSTPFGLPSVVLKPGQRMVFYESQTGIHLDDGGDGVRLIKPNGQLGDAYNYSVVQFPDQSYCRLPDNGGLDDWNQNCAPTPGLRNAPRNGSENLPIVSGDDNSCPIGDTLPLDFLIAECDPFGNNIWSRLYWDAKGWLGEKILPNTNGQWDVYGD